MSSRTIFLTRLIGLYCILVIPSMVLHRQATVDWMTALLNNASLMWVLSVITLTVGLAMVLAHNVWSGGALPVVVTLVGWATLIKGLLFLFLPSGVESEFILSALRNPLLFYVWMTPSLLFNVSPMDPGTYVVATAGILAIAWLACYLPSRHAAALNPVNALRAE